MLDLDELRGLPSEEATNRVAAYLGMPAAVIHNHHQVESGGGRNLRGPEVKRKDGTSRGQAKGHFQSMDETRAAWEKRDPKVASLDLDNYQDALYLYALHMGENLKITKGDVPRAVQGYFSGNFTADVDLDRTDGHTSIRDYVSKVMNGVDAPRAIPQPRQRPAMSNLAPAGVKPAPRTLSGRPIPVPVEEPKQSDAGVLDQALEARRIIQQDPAAMQYTLLDNLLNTFEDDPAKDPANYEQNQTEYEQGLTVDQVEVLRENMHGSRSQVLRVRQQLLDAAKTNAGLGNLGLGSVVLGGVLAQDKNPITVATAGLQIGVGAAARATLAARAAQAAGPTTRLQTALINSRVASAAVAVSPAQALAAQGRAGAAVAAGVAEGAAITAGVAVLDDTIGRQVYTPVDYMVEIGADLALSALPELATLPGALRDAKTAGAPDSVNAHVADLLRQRNTLAADIAEDAAQDLPPGAFSDSDANALNASLVTRETGRRIGGDTNLEGILRSADDADDIARGILAAEEDTARSSRLSDEEPPTRGDTIIRSIKQEYKDAAPGIEKSFGSDGVLGRIMEAAEAGDKDSLLSAGRELKLLERSITSDAERKLVNHVKAVALDLMQQHAKPGRLMTSPDGEKVRLTTRFYPEKAAQDDKVRSVSGGMFKGDKPVETIGYTTARGALTAIKTHPLIDKTGLGPVIDMMLQSGGKALDDMEVVTRRAPNTGEAGVFEPSTNRAAVNVNRSEAHMNRGAKPADKVHFDELPVEEQLRSLTDKPELEAVTHEILHGITGPIIDAVHAYRRGLYAGAGVTPNIPKHWFTLVDEAEDLFARFKSELARSPSSDHGINYAALNLHEFLSQAGSNKETRALLESMKAPASAGGRFMNMWQQFKLMLSRFLTAGMKGTELETATILLDRFLEANAKVDLVGIDGKSRPTAADYHARREAAYKAKAKPQEEFLDAGLTLPSHLPNPHFQVPWAAPRSSMTNQQARKFSDQLNAAAEQHLAANPINEEKLKTLAALAPEKMGMLSTGLILARSKVPLLRRMSQLLTETTTGASGRQATVAVRRDTLVRELASDSLQNYVDIADQWAVENGYKFKDRFITGAARAAFDREVMLHQRRILEAAETRQPIFVSSKHVSRAARELEALYERSARAERQAGTPGSENLPKSSAGYAPQRLNPAALAAASAADLNLIRNSLWQHWYANIGWDMEFSKAIAGLYIDRARARASGKDVYGAKMVDATGIGDVRTAVRAAVDEGAVTAEQAAQAMRSLEANAARGQKSHRPRLDIPMFAPINGKLLADFFVQDQIDLANRHIQATAGEVALTEMGIPGRSGLDRIRIAAFNSAPAPSLAEMRAFDQVTAELFGAAPDSAVYSEPAQALRMTTSVLKLGGVVFNQLSEMTNMLHTLGLTAMLRQVATLPHRIVTEISDLKKGIRRPDSLLASFEVPGGEIGMGDYRMNFPLRASPELQRQYVEDSGILTTLLKSATMVQHKIGLMQAVTAAQHRGVAEEIVRKAARMIRDWDGKGPIPRAMQDMGFTPELVAAVKQNLATVAVFDGGRLKSFDVQALGNQAAVEAFTQAVHRGTRQIIQGTFVGERNAWVHNDYIGVLTQFRTFTLTAMEKQWSRQRFHHDNKAVGYAYVAGLAVTQALLAYPIYAARVYSQALLMDDEERQKFLDSRMNAAALTRGLMNYSAASGATGDMLELALMFGGKTAGVEGARGAGQADLVSTLSPAAGTINQAGRAIGGAVEASLDDTDGNVKVDRVLKTLPYSSLWYAVPFINALKD